MAFLRIQRSGTEVVIAPINDGHGAGVARFEQAAYGYDHRMLDWSPDGRQLEVVEPFGRQIGARAAPHRRQDRAKRPLTNPGEAVTGDIDPRFSPDGSRVSFLRLIHRTQQEIFTVPVNGGAPTQVTKLGRRISSHDWMRDGIHSSSLRIETGISGFGVCGWIQAGRRRVGYSVRGLQ